MEEESVYQVEITLEAEQYYLDVLKYFYKYYSAASADRKSDELLAKAPRDTSKQIWNTCRLVGKKSSFEVK